MNIYAKAKKIHIFKDPYILASTLQTSFHDYKMTALFQIIYK